MLVIYFFTWTYNFTKTYVLSLLPKVLEAYIWVVYTFYPTDYLFIFICVIYIYAYLIDTINLIITH